MVSVTFFGTLRGTFWTRCLLKNVHFIENVEILESDPFPKSLEILEILKVSSVKGLLSQ